MVDKRGTIKDLISNLVAFLLLFNILSVVSLGTGYSMSYAYIAFIVPFLLFYAIRRSQFKTKYKVLLHIAAVLPLLLLGYFNYGELDANLFQRGSLYWFIVFSLMYSVANIVRGEWTLQLRTSVWVGLIYLLMFFLNRVLVEGGFTQTQLVFSYLITLCAVITYTQMENFDFRFLQFKASQHGDSAQNAMKINNRLIAIFSGAVLVIGFFLIFVLPFVGMVSGTSRFLGRFVRRFWLFLMSFWPEVTGFDIEGVVGGGSSEGEGYAWWDEQEESIEDLDLGMAATIITVTVFLVAAAVIIVALIHFILSLIQKDKTKKQSGLPEDNLSVKLGGSFVHDFLGLFPKLAIRPRHPIRRAYAKKVRRHIKKGLSVVKFDTTVVIANKIRPTEDIDGLTNIYEKVRYGRN